jgi:hypothetical protein
MSSSSAIYMLRTMQQQHVALSTLADQKANIIIAGCVGILIFTMGKLEAGEHALWLYALSVTALLSGLSAVVAVKPSFKLGASKDANQLNPLFFGHFVEMAEKDYQAEILALMSSEQAIYEAMLRDIYQLGQTIYYKKYRYLNYSYTIFLAGVFVTLLLSVSGLLWH